MAVNKGVICAPTNMHNNIIKMVLMHNNKIKMVLGARLDSTTGVGLFT